jgi:hypothetical protein
MIILYKNPKALRNAFTLALLLFASRIFGQNPLNEADQRYLNNLKSQLGLSVQQTQSIDSLFNACNEKTILMDAEMKTLQSSDLPEETIASKVNGLGNQKKELRYIRDLEIQSKLTPEQKKIFDETIKPAKPNVLHFGMNHDRASCKVCVKP